MNIPNQEIEITTRFFSALEYLKEQRVIRGIQTFTNRNNIDRRNLIAVRNEPANRQLKIEWIYALAKDYNISLDWIFFGNGNILKQ